VYSFYYSGMTGGHRPTDFCCNLFPAGYVIIYASCVYRSSNGASGLLPISAACHVPAGTAKPARQVIEEEKV